MTKIKNIYLSLALSTIPAFATTAPHITVGSYNVENFFDAVPNDGKRYDYDDSEFTPENGWDQEKVEIKAERIAGVFEAMQNNGGVPDILGLVEVENEVALEEVNEYLGKNEYKSIYVSKGPDVRGINLAVLSKFPLCGETIEKHIKLPSGTRPTRPILAVTVCVKSQPVTIIMNHWSSRAGGPEEKSEPNRIACAKVAKQVYQEIAKKDPNRPVIFMGDFNDEPENVSVIDTLGAKDPEEKSSLYNLALEIANFNKTKDTNELRRKRGSYNYRGNWNALDQMIISHTATNNKSIISYIPKSYQPIAKHPGIGENGLPMRFLDRNKNVTRNGVSDHLPIFAKFAINTQMLAAKLMNLESLTLNR